MRAVNVLAKNIKKGDIINGQRVAHTPLIGGRKNGKRVGTVNFLVKQKSGYKMEHLAFQPEEFVTVRRPVKNMGRRAQSRRIAKAEWDFNKNPTIEKVNCPTEVYPEVTLIDSTEARIDKIMHQIGM